MVNSTVIRIAFTLILGVLIAPSLQAELRVSRQNPRYLVEASDTNTVVFLAGSHTWLNNVNGGWAPSIAGIPPFNWSAYLNFLGTNNQTLVKYWAWESAGQSLLSNSTDYRASHLQAWRRTGPGTAQDGGPKWNLDSLDDSYFARVRGRIDTLNSYGVYAVVMLFNGWSVSDNKNTGFTGKPFLGHPYNIANNIQGIGFSDAQGDNVHRLPGSGGDPAVFAHEITYLKRMIDVLNSADNIVWEISNESNSTSQTWQYAIIDTIRSYESRKPKQHLVNMSVEYPGGTDADLYAGAAHNQTVSPSADYSGAVVRDTSRVIITDTDHICGECKDGDWVYRSFMNGVGSILYMDPWDGRNYPHIANPYDSTASNWVSARRAMGYVVRMARKVNLIDVRPAPQLASTGLCLQGGSKWVVYLPFGGLFTVNLSSSTDTMAVDWLNLQSGSFVQGTGIRAGGISLALTPPFPGSAMVYVHPVSIVSVRTDVPAGIPREVSLSQNYPNPFNPSTTINFDVVQNGIVRLLVYDASGKIVRTLFNGRQAGGRYSVVWDGRDDARDPVASGLYICRLISDGHSLSRKMLLVR